MNEQKSGPAKVEYKRIEDFSEDYANNVFFQSSNWDMKLIFGELDQTLGPNVILQHTAITLPWAQVKMMAYFLTLHLILHEFQNGRVTMGANLIPEVSKQMPKAMRDAGTPDAAWQAIRQLYDQLITANPEAAAKKK